MTAGIPGSDVVEGTAANNAVSFYRPDGTGGRQFKITPSAGKIVQEDNELIKLLDRMFFWNLRQACGDLTVLVDENKNPVLDDQGNQQVTGVDLDKVRAFIDASSAEEQTAIFAKMPAPRGVFHKGLLQKELANYLKHRGQAQKITDPDEQKMILEAFEKATGLVSGKTEQSMAHKIRKTLGGAADHIYKATDHGLNLESNSVGEILKRKNKGGTPKKPGPVWWEWIKIRFQYYFMHHFNFGYVMHQIRRFINFLEKRNTSGDAHLYDKACLEAEKHLVEYGQQVLPDVRYMSRYLLEMSGSGTEVFNMLYHYSGNAPSSVRNFSCLNMTNADKVYMETFESLAAKMSSTQHHNHLATMMYLRRNKAMNGFIGGTSGIKNRNAFSYAGHSVVNNTHVPEILELREGLFKLLAELHTEANSDMKAFLKDSMYYMERTTTMDSIHDIYAIMVNVGALIGRRTNPVTVTNGNSINNRMEAAIALSSGFNRDYQYYLRLAQLIIAKSEETEYPFQVDQYLRYMPRRPRRIFDRIQDTLPFLPLGTGLADVRANDTIFLGELSMQLKQITNLRNELRSSTMQNQYPLLAQTARHVSNVSALLDGIKTSLMGQAKQGFTITSKVWRELVNAMPDLKTYHSGSEPPTIRKLVESIRLIFNTSRQWYRSLPEFVSVPELNPNSDHPLFDASGEPRGSIPRIITNVSFSDVFSKDPSGAKLYNSDSTHKFQVWDKGYMLEINQLKMVELKIKLKTNTVLVQNIQNRLTAAQSKEARSKVMSDILAEQGCFLENKLVKTETITAAHALALSKGEDMTGHAARKRETFCLTTFTMQPKHWQKLHADLTSIFGEIRGDDIIPFFNQTNAPQDVPRMEPNVKMGYAHHAKATDGGHIPLVEHWNNHYGYAKLFNIDGYDPNAMGRMYYRDRNGNLVLQFLDWEQYANAHNPAYWADKGFRAKEKNESSAAYQEAFQQFRRDNGLANNDMIDKHYLATSKGTEDFANSINRFGEVRYRNYLNDLIAGGRRTLESTIENNRNICSSIEQMLLLIEADEPSKGSPENHNYFRIKFDFWFIHIDIKIPKYRNVDMPSRQSEMSNFQSRPDGTVSMGSQYHAYGQLSHATTGADINGMHLTAKERREKGKDAYNNVVKSSLSKNMLTAKSGEIDPWDLQNRRLENAKNGGGGVGVFTNEEEIYRQNVHSPAPRDLMAHLRQHTH